MPVGWTIFGACTSGSIAHPRDATRRASGGATTTSTTSTEPNRGHRRRNQGTGGSRHGFRARFPASLLRRVGVALRRQRDGDDRVVRVHVDDGRNGDARRLDDVDGLDADARADLAWRGGVVPRHVAGDDGGDDAAIPGADAVALSASGWRNRRDSCGPADRAGGRRILPGVGGIRNGRLSARRCAGGGGDGGTVGGACRSDGGRRGHHGRRRTPVHRVEGASPCLLPADAGALPDAARARRLGLAIRPQPRLPLQLLLYRLDGGPARRRGHGPARDGGRGGSHYRRTTGTGRSACRADHWSRARRRRIVRDRASSWSLGNKKPSSNWHTPKGRTPWMDRSSICTPSNSSASSPARSSWRGTT